jgi:hypothetical protein
LKDINYYRAISNSLNCTPQQSDLYEAQNALLYDFDTNPSCKTVLLNDVKTNVILYIETDIITGGKSYKVRCKPNQILKIGDILNIDNEIWFVTKVDVNKLVSYAGTLAKATCILKFYKNGIYRELPCYINVGTRNYINERDNDFIRLPKSLYTAYCPDLGYLDKEDVNMRFVIRDYVYRAVGIDNLTVLDNEVRDGLIIMKLQDDATLLDDNMELGIANYWSNQENNSQNEGIATFGLRKRNLNTELKDKYTASIDYKKDYFICGEQVKITGSIQNRNGYDILANKIFYITDENNNEIDYVKVVSQDNNSITIKISNSAKCYGKKVKLRIDFPQFKNTSFEKTFTINGMV